MRSRIAAAFALAAFAAAPLGAQQMMADHQEMGSVAAVRPFWDRIKDLYLKSAQEMPEDKYGFAPTKGVRTFGQILGHVANENYVFCAGAVGLDNPNKTDFEHTISKPGLIAALNASFAFCDAAYAMDDKMAMQPVELFGQKGSRLWAIIYNVTHDGEHYGNLVTYFRINGLVPPSSQNQSG